VNRIIAPEINLSPEEITEYVKKMPKEDENMDDPKDPNLKKEAAPGSEKSGLDKIEKPDNEKVIKNLRRMKIEEAYKKWIGKHKESYNVEINNEKWIEILGVYTLGS